MKNLFKITLSWVFLLVVSILLKNDLGSNGGVIPTVYADIPAVDGGAGGGGGTGGGTGPGSSDGSAGTGSGGGGCCSSGGGS